MRSFPDFGLLPSVLTTLKAQKLSRPTEIQAQIIPLLMSGQSAVGVSETGSGKTLAFVLPILNALKTLENEKNPVTNERSPRAIILAPTRDLGEQISRVFKTFTHDTRIRVRPALGGTKFEQARRNAADVFEVLLATPGRLIQLIQGNLIDLSDVRMLVCDEADQLIDEGFLTTTKAIVKACPHDIQMSLFSATISAGVQELINELFPKAEVVRSSGSGAVTATLQTKNVKVEDGKRWPVLERILSTPAHGGTMLFTNTREQCDALAKQLNDANYPCVIYRGEMDKLERRGNLRKFREGQVKLLVSTDLAARGLDVNDVGCVINYHLPKQMENYLHRAGRTARAGRPGVVINLVTERDMRLVEKLDGTKPRFADRPFSKKPSPGKSSPRRA